jgi:hypothetical protein
MTDPLFEIRFENGVPISPIVRTHKQWENHPFKTQFYVMNVGIVL